MIFIPCQKPDWFWIKDAASSSLTLFVKSFLFAVQLSVVFFDFFVGPNKILIQTPFYAIFQSPPNSLKSGICIVYAFKLKGMHSTTIFRNYYNVLWFYGCMFFYLHNWPHIHVCFCQVCDLHSPVPAHQFHIFMSVSARFAIYIPLFLPISFTYSLLFLPGLRSTFPCSCPSVSPCWLHCGRRISGGEGRTNQNKSDNTTLYTASFCIMNCFVWHRVL